MATIPDTSGVRIAIDAARDHFVVSRWYAGEKERDWDAEYHHKQGVEYIRQAAVQLGLIPAWIKEAAE